MDSIIIDGRRLNYVLRRSKKRKSIGISISIEHGLVVSVPYNINKKNAEQLLIDKSQWIIKHLNDVESVKKDRQERKYVNGEKLKYLGEDYLLKVFYNCSNKDIIVIQDKEIQVNLKCIKSKEDEYIILKNKIMNWYRKEAYKILREVTEVYAKELSVKPNNITVKNVQSIWGSCSSKNNINYNLKLVMAPMPVIEYVVVHELCHIIHRNHSKEFWSLVKSILPDYENKKTWLKKNGYKLNFNYIY